MLGFAGATCKEQEKVPAGIVRGVIGVISIDPPAEFITKLFVDTLISSHRTVSVSPPQIN